jgi:hypothetical protein
VSTTVGAPAARLYLDLLKSVLTRTVTDHGFEGESLALIEQGVSFLPEAETMIGLPRLDNLDECIRAVISDGIPGDLMECGVWRGGAAIFMRAALEAYGDSERSVWMADSFQGVSRPDPAAFPEDVGLDLWKYAHLAVPREQVEANFARYGLLDDRVRIIEGWFRDTLPTAPVESLAVLRLDGDMYESTFVALEALYDKVSPGGFVIVDDYHLEPCRLAVEDFRGDKKIDEPVVPIDWTGVYWRKRL